MRRRRGRDFREVLLLLSLYEEGKKEGAKPPLKTTSPFP
jgi:hypothetical protein